MKKDSILIVISILFLLILSSAATLPQHDQNLFQKALTKERAEGNLEEAIKLYQQVVKTSKDKSLAAKAQLRIGICYGKLGQKNTKKALGAFQKVIDNYPGQTEAVRVAREKLALLIRAQSVIEKEQKEFRITKIHTEKKREGYISPDGKKLALIDKGNIWIRDMFSGEETHIVNDRSEILDILWSPDCETISYLNLAWDVSVVPVKGGTPKTIIKAKSDFIKSGNVIYPSCWTADSKNIVFKDTTKGLFSMPKEGGKWKEIYKYSSPEEGKRRIREVMVLSPDGKFIAYDPTIDGNQDIYIMPVGNKESIRITHDPSNDSWPQWSNDGKWLSFYSERSRNTELWAVGINPDGKPSSKPIQVSRGEARGGTWTNDGNIIFSTSEGVVNLFTANLDGSEEVQVTKIKGAVYPRWSPDGKTIVFTRENKDIGKRAIWTIPSQGGEEKHLSVGEFPIWSPNGKFIAFNAKLRSFPFKTVLSIIPSEGGDPKELMNHDGFLRNLDWSPDGKYIAFSYSRRKNDKNPIQGSRLDIEDIYIIPAKGGKPKRITKMDKKGFKFTSPRWSPDGKKIAFRILDYETYAKRGQGEPIGIWTINIDGSGPKLIAQGLDGWELSWTKDSKFIITSKHEEGSKEPWVADHKLYRISVESGKIEKLNITGRMVDVSSTINKVVYSRFSGAEKIYWLAENFLPKKK